MELRIEIRPLDLLGTVTFSPGQWHHSYFATCDILADLMALATTPYPRSTRIAPCRDWEFQWARSVVRIA